MTSRKIIIAIVVLLVVLGSAAYSQSKVGTTAAQFLGIDVGPRATAMGGSYVAENTDVSTIYWNPGAFVMADKSQFEFSSSDWLVGTKFQWFGFMANLDSTNAIGVSLTELNYGSDIVTTVEQPDGTGNEWSAQDLCIALSYSRRLTDHFSIGGSAKFINQSIWNENATTLAFDLGLLYITGFNNMRLGMSMCNFGGDLTLSGKDLLNQVTIDANNPGTVNTLVASMAVDPWALPLLFRVGLAMDVVKNDDMSLTVSADALRPSDNVETINLGGELGWHDLVFFRGGYKSLFYSNSQQGLCLGAGLKDGLPGWGMLEVDYSFTKFGVFDNINAIAVVITF
jgi:hypothetical protein